MDTQAGNDSPLLPISTLGLMLAALVTVFFSQPELGSSRHMEADVVRRPIDEPEFVDARLWQDPLMAVQMAFAVGRADLGRQRSAGDQDTTRLNFANTLTVLAKNVVHLGSSDAESDILTSHLASEPAPSGDQGASGPQAVPVKAPEVLVLGVMVNGGPAAEEAETRRRTRVAVHSAMSARGFVPDDAEHIGIADASEVLSKPHPDQRTERLTLAIPFEWLRRDPITTFDVGHELPRAVLVLWIDEAFLSDEHPLASLEDLFSAVLGSSESSSVSMRVLGPSGSDILLAMIEELAGDTPDTVDVGPPPPRIVVLNARATLPRQLAARSEKVRDRLATKKTDLEGLLDQPGRPRIMSVIGEDHHAALATVLELERRGVTLEPDGAEDEHADHVALFSEWDTLYGRALPLVFEAAVRYCTVYREGDTGCRRDPDHRWPACWDEHVLSCLEDVESRGLGTFHHVSYLRGLDGLLPEEHAAVRDTSGAAGRIDSLDVPALVPYGLQEHAIGRNQFDQLRRVANTLERLDRERAELGLGRIRAVGILGSDFYDKQLVLEALRRDFPHAIFFTTDMDARFLHSDRYESNRNLLVASAYGLELVDRLQGDVPPFRDTYQTSAFVACRLALEDRPDQAGLWKLAENAQLHPRLFEIGRREAIDLTPRASDAASASIHPTPRLGAPTWGTAARLLLLVALAAGLVLAMNPGVREGVLRHRRPALVLAAITAFGTLDFVAVVRSDVASGVGEPFALFDGVSIWPTEALRLLAALCCWIFLVMSWTAVDDSVEVLSAAYGLMGSAELAQRGRSPRWWHHVRGASLSIALRQVVRRLVRRRGSVSIGAWGTMLRTRLRGKHDRGPVASEAPRSRAGRSDVRKAASSARTGKRTPRSTAAKPTTGEAREALQRPSIDVRHAWRRYVVLSRLNHRVIRLLPLVLVFLVMAWVLMRVLGFPHVPYRGERALQIDRFVLRLSVFSLVGLTFFVFDATRLCARLVHALGWSPSAWPDASSVRGFVGADAADWRDIEFAARVTEPVGRLILYPFVGLLIMLISRHEIFDDWDWPLSLGIVFITMACAVVAAGLSLRRVSERARERVLQRMRERHAAMEDGPLRDRYASLMGEVQAVRRGAFASWSGNPVLRAVLIPFGGMGGLVLIEMFAR